MIFSVPAPIQDDGQKLENTLTHLLYAMELQTMCHVVVQNKLAKQHILGKYSNCKIFGVTMDLLNIKNFTVVITWLQNVQQV